MQSVSDEQKVPKKALRALKTHFLACKAPKTRSLAYTKNALSSLLGSKNDLQVCTTTIIHEINKHEVIGNGIS